MSGYIDTKCLRECFKAWVGEAKTFVSMSAAGAARRSELLGSAVSGIRSLFSRETWMSAKEIPKPSLESAAIFAGLAIGAGGFYMSSSTTEGMRFAPAAASVFLLLQHVMPYSNLETGGTPFAGGVWRGMGVGFGLFVVSLGVKYLLYKLLYKVKKLTYVFDAENLKGLLTQKMHTIAVASLAVVSSVTFTSQLLGYLSSKMPYGYPLAVFASIFSYVYVSFSGATTLSERFKSPESALFLNCFVSFMLMGISYRASGNMLAPIVYSFLRLIDFFAFVDKNALREF